MSNAQLYLLCFLCATILSVLLTPLMRRVALHLNILDHPHSSIKTHKQPVPYLGGVAVAVALVITLIGIRFFTAFPTGTLHSMRGYFLGGSLILLLGLIDDATPAGLGYRFKFAGQVAAAWCLIAFDIRIAFLKPAWFGVLLTMLWVVGITNALNIIDIMDGLASGIAVIACVGFLFISLPSEEIYVNFIAAAMAGAILGFIPYNLSRQRKIFLGDTGSLFAGFTLATLSMGTSYTQVNNAGVFAPLLILGLPIYDTLLVSYLRITRGASPFLGSKDHYALRLEKWGLYREEILLLSYAAGLALMFIAYQVTALTFEYAILLYLLTSLLALLLGTWLSRIEIDH